MKLIRVELKERFNERERDITQERDKEDAQVSIAWMSVSSHCFGLRITRIVLGKSYPTSFFI